ncbi:MAG: hypothetical protein NVSMB12_11410 [Acidimicrobiales bacterium]
MAVGKLVHKRPCPCGTGRPARDCCGRFRRLSDAEIARSYLSRQARQARDLIGPFSPQALHALQTEAATLPARYDAFTDALLAAPDAVAGEVRRMARALQRRSEAGDEIAAPRLSATRADTPMARVAIAKALLALREEGVVDEHLVAAAVIELAGGPSPLAGAALIQAAGVVAGIMGRPAAGPGPAPARITQPATA